MINQYEIEIIVKNRQGQERLVTLNEWAYDAKDAFNQVIYNHIKHLKIGEEFSRLERIGPPQQLIARASEIVRQASEAFERIIAGRK